MGQRQRRNPLAPLCGPFTNTVAEETIDPLGQASGNILCTDFDYLCRYSDAAYAELDSDEDLDLDLGHIAEPEDYNTIEVNPAYDTLEIDPDSGAFSVDDEWEYCIRDIRQGEHGVLFVRDASLVALDTSRAPSSQGPGSYDIYVQHDHGPILCDT